MRSPREVVEDTDWSRLEHAYAAASDTPAQLLHLLSEDAERCGDALAYLDSAVLHQGSIYSSTAPAAEFVAGILDDPRTLVPCRSAALDEVRAALRDPEAADAWFGADAWITGDRPPQLEGQVRFSLLRALLRRTATFDEVADEAVAVARMTNQYTVDSDWGPLLERAFAGSAPGPLSPAQRRFLAALVDNDACWGNIGNPLIWFRKAGLPAEREELRALLA